MSTLPVLNLRSPFTDPKTGKLLPPWNSFLQQLVQAAPAVAGVVVGASPFSYTANANGTLIVSGGTVSLISLTRGPVTILIATSTANPVVVPISIGDTVNITYSVLPTVQFLGA